MHSSMPGADQSLLQYPVMHVAVLIWMDTGVPFVMSALQYLVQHVAVLNRMNTCVPLTNQQMLAR